MGRLADLIAGRVTRDKILFVGSGRQSVSTQVRGEQMAEELEAVWVKNGFLDYKAVQSAPALIWVQHPDIRLVRKYKDLTIQILDVIAPEYSPERRADFYERCRAFRHLIINTKSTRKYMGAAPDEGWKAWVIPHHHCNATNYLLPEDRLERPRMVGYIGDPAHLQDTEEIEQAVRKMGLTFLRASSKDLETYQLIDIGIAWTRPNEIRDDTQSNIKLTNFVAHGIPSVVPNYESYRDVDEALETGTTTIRSDLGGWLEGLRELVNDEGLRRTMASKAPAAQIRYSRKSIGALYKGMIFDCRTGASE